MRLKELEKEGKRLSKDVKKLKKYCDFLEDLIVRIALREISTQTSTIPTLKYKYIYG